jgi:hypothetical protein
MNLSREQLLEIARYLFFRLDGAWFLALVRKLEKEMDVIVEHTKNLNQGDDCCDVVISRQPMS